MATLSERTYTPVALLMSSTCLAWHPRASAALDRDVRTIDLQLLDPDSFDWSSGERVLLGVVRAIATGAPGASVGDLVVLDSEHRQACLQALQMWLAPQEVLL